MQLQLIRLKESSVTRFKRKFVYGNNEQHLRSFEQYPNTFRQDATT